MIRNIEIPDDALDICDTSQLERILRELEANPENVRQLQGTVMVSFDVEAPVVVLEPRVKAFLLQAHDRIPHLWYYLVADPDYSNVMMFLAVHADPSAITVDGDNFSVQPGPNELAMLLDRLAETYRFATRMADDGDRILEEILAPFPPQTRARLLAGAIELAEDGG
jgi:hypothetical protein